MLREDKADTYKQKHIHINTLQSDDVCVMIYSIESRESTFIIFISIAILLNRANLQHG